MEQTSSFGYWLRSRKALDLTQDEFAQRVGCATATIKKIEADERCPSRQMAERLVTCLEIPDSERPDFLRAARGELADDCLASPLETPPSSNPSAHGYYGNSPTRSARSTASSTSSQPVLGADFGRSPDLTSTAHVLRYAHIG